MSATLNKIFVELTGNGEVFVHIHVKAIFKVNHKYQHKSCNPRCSQAGQCNLSNQLLIIPHYQLFNSSRQLLKRSYSKQAGQCSLNNQLLIIPHYQLFNSSRQLLKRSYSKQAGQCNLSNQLLIILHYQLFNSSRQLLKRSYRKQRNCSLKPSTLAWSFSHN